MVAGYFDHDGLTCRPGPAGSRSKKPGIIQLESLPEAKKASSASGSRHPLSLFSCFFFAKPLGALLFNDPRTGILLKCLALARNLNCLCLLPGILSWTEPDRPLVWSEAAETVGGKYFCPFYLVYYGLKRAHKPRSRIYRRGINLFAVACLMITSSSAPQ